MRNPPSLEQLLLGYAAGRLGTMEALLVSALVSLNVEARRAVSRYEALGGRVIEEEQPSGDCTGCLQSVLARIDACTQAISAPAPRPTSLPEPVAVLFRDCGYVEGRDSWLVVRQGVETMLLRVQGPCAPRQDLHVMRLSPGSSVPPHRHHGTEITLVVDGSYSDCFGTHARGDIVIVADAGVVHSPTAGPQGCVCLVLLSQPEHPLQRMMRFLTGR